MGKLLTEFEIRLSEIHSFLDLITSIDEAVKSGSPNIGGTSGSTITTEQQRILYSCVYLQLYNLVESTIINCLEEVTKSSMIESPNLPGNLNENLRREWVRFLARTHTEMGADKRLESALTLCNHLVSSLPVGQFDIDRGGGGNWDDVHIENMAKRLGFRIKLSQAIRVAIKQPIRDDLGPLRLIVSLRNKLAHGSISFSECGQNDTAKELIGISEKVASYLRTVVTSFSNYLISQEYLVPDARNGTAA